MIKICLTIKISPFFPSCSLAWSWIIITISLTSRVWLELFALNHIRHRWRGNDSKSRRRHRNDENAGPKMYTWFSDNILKGRNRLNALWYNNKFTILCSLNFLIMSTLEEIYCWRDYLSSELFKLRVYDVLENSQQ